MKTQKEDPEVVEQSAKGQKQEKREVISISVTSDEKRKISVEALKKYNTSVSDLIRKRMFLDHEAEEQNVQAKEENEEYHLEVIQELKSDLLELENENAELKLKLAQAKSAETENNQTVATGYILSFADDQDGRNLIEMIKAHRAELFENLSEKDLESFYDFEKYIQTMFLRGLKRTFNNGLLKEETGLSISMVKQVATLEDIEYSTMV